MDKEETHNIVYTIATVHRKKWEILAQCKYIGILRNVSKGGHHNSTSALYTQFMYKFY